MIWRRKSEVELLREDAALLSGLRAAQASEALPRVTWVLYLMLAAVAAAFAWASQTRVDEITKADARVVPDGREQVIASLEGGILREMRVREGMQVNEGDELAQLDPTRAEAQQNEGEAKRLALTATLARLAAESRGEELKFPKDVLEATVIRQSETEAFDARRRALTDAVATNQRSVDLLMREVRLAETMSAKGLMSDVEVFRLRRQVNDLQMQSRERNQPLPPGGEHRHGPGEIGARTARRAEGRARRHLAAHGAEIPGERPREDHQGGHHRGAWCLREGRSWRSCRWAPKILVEARVKPADIGFVRVGQQAVVKLSAYEYTVYGGLQGKIVSISPDAIGDMDKSASVEGSYYRAIVRVDREGRENLKAKGKPLPVIPGMTGSAEVHTGERSVMSFLLRPMLKSREAFRER